MFKKINILIIGAGDISRHHLKSLADIKEINVYGILSRTRSKSLLLFRKFKIDNLLYNFKDIKTHIKNIDIFMVLVNPDQILGVFNKIKKYNKFIFFEKPLGVNYVQANKIYEEVKRLKLRTFVGFNRRYYSNLIIGIKKLLKNDAKINSVIIEGNERIWLVKKIKKHIKYLKYWPYINSIHTVDLIRYLVGDIDFNSSFSIKSKNSYLSILKSLKGINVNYTSNYDYYDGWSLKIYNNQGNYLKLKPLEKCEYIDHQSVKIIKPTKSDLKYKFGFREMHLELINSYKNKSKKIKKSSVQDAIKSVELVKFIFYKKKHARI